MCPSVLCASSPKILCLRRNLDVMNELLMENEPGKEEADDVQLMTELHTTLRAMQERATALIGRVTDEIVLGIRIVDLSHA